MLRSWTAAVWRSYKSTLIVKSLSADTNYSYVCNGILTLKKHVWPLLKVSQGHNIPLKDWSTLFFCLNWEMKGLWSCVNLVKRESQACRKRQLNGAFPDHIKRLAPCRCLDRHVKVKNPTKYLWRWEPDRRSNFFFSLPAHLCAVTYITEISLIVTLNNQFTSPQTDIFHWKIFATVFLCFITGKWHQSVNIRQQTKLASFQWKVIA